MQGGGGFAEQTFFRHAAIADRDACPRQPQHIFETTAPEDGIPDMRFDLFTLQLFVAVIEEGSIARAAEREHIAASALSKRIKELERSVRTPLIARNARGISPTIAGREFANRARTILHSLEDLSYEMRDFSNGQRGLIRIFANVSVITQFLPIELKQFLQRYPNIQIDLREGISSVITRAVAENVADIGIYTQADDEHGLTVFPYHSDTLVLVVPKNHSLGKLKSVSFSETLEEEYVGMHKESPLNYLLTRAASAAHRSLKLRCQVTAFDAVIAMVRVGLGIGIVPSRSATALYASAGVRIVPLTDAWAVRDLRLCVRSPDSLAAPAKLLLDHLRSMSRPR